MAGVIQDQYELGQSVKKSLSELGQEIRLDLSLKPNSNLEAGTIFGTVKDTQGNPVPGATIKIMDKDHNPLAHTVTGPDGSYIISPFPPGPEYHIYAQADGYLLAEQLPFALLPKQQVEKNFILTRDPDALLSIIAGEVMDNQTPPHAVKGAIVNLYQVDELGHETLIAVTYTNEFGQFTFRDLQKGNYIVRISGLGYIPVAISVVISADSTIAKVIATLNVDPQASKGTISGVITDNNNVPIADADVVLYRVEADGSLTPIAVTRTNDEGVYLFTKVPQGDYKIKSTKSITI
ncbi:Carboxypeptidase regulatory-like domain-containing protein [Caloramator quimbayensis]|uniref:Carboxypeptidase regulatory-like domain-containing protein n=1 Tax=Caloramator quimbayensis TaxID=1147123 RepID=A0A1T4Y638_9CLOT|nr:carboxypeptidase regulatory-like domain-containing protein [Caloramator quimbayensis]SKA97206.1 Carboxypeptidase regulatory-like domain-containing protein [Caloramator quimbayensis]